MKVLLCLLLAMTLTVAQSVFANETERVELRDGSTLNGELVEIRGHPNETNTGQTGSAVEKPATLPVSQNSFGVNL